MKNIKTLLSIMAFGFVTLNATAEDILPSEAYYRDHIAVNVVNSVSPTIDDDDDLVPGPGGGGEDIGDGEQVGGPIGDALLPLLTAGMLYGSVIFFRKRKKA